MEEIPLPPSVLYSVMFSIHVIMRHHRIQIRPDPLHTTHGLTQF